MSPFSKIRLSFLLLAALLSLEMAAQDNSTADPDDVPLGDVARNLRKKTPPSQDVIDDDNLSQVMRQSENLHPPGSALKFLMSGESKVFQISAPDATCSLSFTANTKALLSGQYAQMDLPPADVLKIAGPATIEGDALTVSVFNGTDWHVSELAIALTVVRKNDPRDVSIFGESGQAGIPVAGSLAAESEVRPEKKPDMTVIYRMRAPAPPFAKTTFSAPLNLDLAPGDEWHWAIVQAKGYPPQTYTASVAQSTAQAREPAVPKPIAPSSLVAPQDSSATPLPPAAQ